MRELKEKGSILPLLAIILIILVGAAGLFLVKSGALTQLTDQTFGPRSLQLASPVPATSGSDITKLSQQSSSDDPSSIQKDLNDTDLSGIDKELTNIDKELSSN